MAGRDLTGHVLDLLTTHLDEGLGASEMAVLTGDTKSNVQKAIHDLRLLFADDEIFITCDPNGKGEEWTYRLVSGKAMVDATDSVWVSNRILDTEARLTTMQAAMAAAKHATDGRSVEGRKARMLHKVLTRLREDLNDLDGG